MLDLYDKIEKVGELSNTLKLTTNDPVLQIIISNILKKESLQIRSGYEENGSSFETEELVDKTDKRYLEALAESLESPYFGVIRNG